MQKTIIALSGVLCASGLPSLAQNSVPTPNVLPTQAPPPSNTQPTTPVVSSLGSLGGFQLSGNLRSRIEYVNWFEPTSESLDDDYFYTGHLLRLSGVRSNPRFDVQIDLQGVVLTSLPDNSIAPAPQGQLGFGASYNAANRGQDAVLGLKQAFVRFKNSSRPGQSVRLGRFEFSDGAEVPAGSPTLNFLKSQRIAQRLIGPFGFTHAGRSFDGAQFSTPLGQPNTHFTSVVARPTEGVFKLEAFDNVDGVGFLYGALSKSSKTSDARLFGLVYEDTRDASDSVKTDNRPLSARQADSDAIRVYTLGAHYLKTIDTGGGALDLLGWGALQSGDWGTQDHAAHAFALEVGYQPKNSRLKPWYRVGVFRSSGDDDATDGDHETFLTPLPTPRLYNRFPFYNQMNLTDYFGQVILRPNPKVNYRFEAHALRLSEGSDLWYIGGGPFDDSGFGTGGRPGAGNESLATVLDFSVDYAINPQTSLGFYLGHAFGGDVIEGIYPTGSDGTYAFLEFSRKF